MKFLKLLSISGLFCLLSINVSAQWTTITNLTGSTVNYGGVDVTVTSNNGTTGGSCGGLYWLVNSNDYYTYSFSVPVSGIQISIDAINVNESVEFYINGSMFPIMDCNLDANPFVNNCSVGNCNIVNGQFVNNTSMWVCGGLLTFYGPISTFTVKVPLGGSGPTYNISMAQFGTNVGGCYLQTSVLGTFNVYANSTCAGPDINVMTNSYTSGMTVHTFFGDGSDLVSTVQSGNGFGYALVDHEYAMSGTYNIKQILYIGSNAVDSAISVYEHHFCTDIPVVIYNDLDNNCAFDTTDTQPYLPVLVTVDSNNVTIDTISTTAGFFYRAYGNPGDTYDFKIGGLPLGMIPLCPSTGEINLTLQSLVYYTNPNLMGLGCSNTSNYDLGVNAFLSTAANGSDANITVSNYSCQSQNGVLTMTYSPKYTFYYSYPNPTSQTANTITWNLNNLSSVMSAPASLSVHLVHNGTLLTPGDTVHTSFSLTPTMGDVNPVNNIIIREDTVTAPVDPNAVYVNPKGCVEAGTNLEYTITFENMGNAPAEDIYIMDTLSNDFDLKSMKLVTASHLMNVTKISSGGYNILKFDFPNINLPDSSDPARHGFVTYTIDTKNTLPYGWGMSNKAGIYFDYMPAVLTNEAVTQICWPATVAGTASNAKNIILYPNPAGDELFVQTGVQYSSFTIANSVGQQMMQQQLANKETTLNIKSLPAGIYYISLKGENGTEVRKFVKM